MQIFRPLLLDASLKDYFSSKLNEIDNMSETEKMTRFKIIR